MLTRMKLDNFKAWREADLQIGKVTGFFGTNSAGKSSLLQLLLLLKQTRNATDRGLVLDFGEPEDLANLGTFKDVVHAHDEKAQIRWLLEWTLPKMLAVYESVGFSEDSVLVDDSLQTRCAVGLRRERPWSYELAYRFCGVEFKLQPKGGREREFKLETDSDEIRFVRNQGRAWPVPHPIKTHLFPVQTRTFYQNAHFLGDFELAYDPVSRRR